MTPWPTLPLKRVVSPARAITYGIVREHEGTIECESGMGQGTRFILSFPAVVAERAPLADQGLSGRAAGPGQGLL